MYEHVHIPSHPLVYGLLDSCSSVISCLTYIIINISGFVYNGNGANLGNLQYAEKITYNIPAYLLGSSQRANEGINQAPWYRLHASG